MTASSERVLQLIRERMKQNQYLNMAPGTLKFIPLELPEKTQRSVVDLTRRQWSLAEMLQHHDRLFVQNAYTVLLRRDPDISGVTGRLDALRQGTMTRVELLFRLRYGPEGKIHKVQVKGLTRAFLIDRACAVPIIGVVPRTLRAIARLPRMQRDIEEIRSLLAMQKNDTDDRLDIVVDFQNGNFEKLSRTLKKNNAP